MPIFDKIAEEISKAEGFAKVSYLGAGAFKEVYHAVDGDGRGFALKVLDPLKSTPDRSAREVEAMIRASSPYIGKLIKFDQMKCSDGNSYPFMIEELFDGGSLDGVLTGGSLPSKTDTLNWAKCLSEALIELWKHKLVHRDIKPDNVMFKTKGGAPALVDFGLVRDLNKDSLTGSWLPRGPGTPYYASPEQLNNDKAMIDWRSDQFCLGITLGIVVTGKHPFELSAAPSAKTVDLVAKRERAPQVFTDQIEKCGLKPILRMIEPWPVKRFLSPAELRGAWDGITP